MTGLTTFSGYHNRADGFIIKDGADSTIITIPKNNLSSPINNSYTNGALKGVVWGKDIGVNVAYSTYPYVVNTRSPGVQRTAIGLWGYVDADSNPISNNYPYYVGYGNGLFMLTPYRSSAVTGNVYTSADGFPWTKYTGVLPSKSGFVGVPVYNDDDGRWAAAGTNNSVVYYSDDDGATWSSTTPTGATGSILSITYGNGLWIANEYQKIYVSDDNMSTWSSVTIGTNPFPNTRYITYNPYDQTFFAGSGIYNGANDYDGRINSSTDGITWTTRYSSTANIYVKNIQGDDDGNYIAVGETYNGSAFIGTTAYLYSTDNGVTWTEGTLPAAIRGFEGGATYGSMDLGTPPAGTPPAATYSVTSDVDSVSEGGTVTFTVTTTGVADGTFAYWTVNGINGIDFTDNLAGDGFTINSNTGTFSRTLKSDSLTEGTESFTMEIRTASVEGPIVATSGSITVADTSQNPPPPPKVQPTIQGSDTLNASVPLGVVNNYDVDATVVLRNNTPYTLTVDMKKYSDEYSSPTPDGTVITTFTINAYTETTYTFTIATGKGWNSDTTNFNTVYEFDARGASGTPDRFYWNVSRIPYTPVITPSSGSTYSVSSFSDPNNYLPIQITGGEPGGEVAITGANAFTQQQVQIRWGNTYDTITLDSSGNYEWDTTSGVPYGLQAETHSWLLRYSTEYGTASPDDVTHTINFT